MRVNVVLYGMLRERLAKETRGRLTVELPEGSRLADLRSHLDIQSQVGCSINGQIERDPQRVLQDGDEVHLFQSIGGGSIENSQD
jgi:sulfur carrier protein ThiS